MAFFRFFCIIHSLHLLFFQSFLKGETQIPSDEAFQNAVHSYNEIFLKAERSFIHLRCHSFTRPFIQRDIPQGRTLIHSFNLSFIHPPIHTTRYSSRQNAHSFIYVLIHSFKMSFIHLPIHATRYFSRQNTHSFIYILMHS